MRQVDGDLTHGRRHVGAHLVDQRAVEEPVTDRPRQAGDRRMTPAGRLDHVVERVAQARQRRLLPVEQRHDDGHLVVASLLRHEDAQQRRFQFVGRIEAVDAVVGDRSRQPIDEPGRESFALRVERTKERVEVLTGRRHGFTVDVLALGRERAQVGERVEDPQGGAFGDRVAVDLLPGSCRVHVEPEHEGAHDLIGRGGRRAPERIQIDRPLLRSRGRSAVDVVRLQAEQRRTGEDLHVATDEHVAHASADGCGDRHLHLHRFDHGEPLTDLDDVVHRDVDADHEGRRRRPHDARIVTGESVGHAVDLDQLVAVLGRRHDAEHVPDRSSAGSAISPAVRHRRAP